VAGGMFTVVYEFLLYPLVETLLTSNVTW